MTIYKICERGLTTATFFSALTKKPPAMKLHVAAILVIFWLGVFSVHTVKGGIASQSMQKISCVNLSTEQLNIRKLVSYEKQQVPVEAIMFITAKGIKICVSPKLKWVQAAMKKIDQKRITKGR
ncbi:lymphotactin-like [Accipiter gentilis]|uniref:lymphotactin-like n=1 Tax=Astur gentilis TaxID=8957 RepID=UPI002110AAD4|nr:lymphotactin-like [Accipiter gentilis]